MAEDRHAKAAEQARRDLERVRGESGVIGTSALARAAKQAQAHFAAADVPENDWAEIWGRRIARALAAALTLFLLWWLARTLLT